MTNDSGSDSKFEQGQGQTDETLWGEQAPQEDELWTDAIERASMAPPADDSEENAPEQDKPVEEADVEEEQSAESAEDAVEEADEQQDTEEAEGAEAGADEETEEETDESAEASDDDASGPTPSSVDFAEELNRELTSELEEAITAAEDVQADSPDKAFNEWKKAWELAPGHPVLVEKLVDCFSVTQKWPSLADFFKKQANIVTDEGYKINMLMTLASIYDDLIQQDVMVINTYQQVIRLRGNFLPAIDAAISKYEQMERWPDLVKLLKAKGEAVTDTSEKVAIFLQVANLFQDRFSNQAEAIKAYEAVLNAEPGHPEAIAFLKEMYEKRRDWEKMLGLMRQEAEQAPEGPERAIALVEIALIATEKLKRPNICVDAWEAVLEQDTENEAAISNLVGLYERTKEWEKLTSVIETQIATEADATEQAKLWLKLGQVYGDKIGDNEKSIEAWKALLDLDPNDRRAGEQLKKRYLAAGAFDELEEFYAATEKWDELIRVLEREADKPEGEKEKSVELLFKVAELYRDKKERQDRATKSYLKILEIDPDNLQAADELIPVLEEDKDRAQFANVLEVKLRHLETDDEKLEMLRRIAQIAEEEIEDNARAFENYLQALQLAVFDEQARDDLERVAGKASRFEDVVQAYTAALEDADADQQFELQLRKGRVLDRELGQSEEALAIYDGILSEDPKNAKAVNALERIYAQMGRFEELLNIYARRIEMAEDDEERKEIYYNQALLTEEEIGDTEKATEIYQKIIEMAGDEERSLSALDRIYGTEEKWAELADVLARQLTLGPVEQEAELDLKYRLGHVSQNQLGESGTALTCYREIIEVAPEHEQAIASLEELLGDENLQAEAAMILSTIYEEKEVWPKLIAATEILVRHSDDNFERFELLTKAGRIQATDMGEPEVAFKTYGRAFNENLASNEVIEEIEKLATVLDLWSDYATLLEEGARKAEDGFVAKALWLRAAKLLDVQLEETDRSIAAYKAALEADPQETEAIAALEQIYSREEKWADLVEILQNKVEQTDSAEEKIPVYKQIATILEEMIDRPEDAVSAHREILNLDPANEDALKGLDHLFVALERWTDLADNLQQQLSYVSDPDAIIALKLRLGKLREIQLSEVAGAIAIYAEVLEMEDDNAGAIEALEGIIEQPDFRREVAEMLEPVYRALGIWEKLIGVIEILVAEDETPARRIDLLHEIAQLYESSGDDPEKAFNTLGRALEEDPSDERTREELERLARTLVMYDELATLYVSVVEKTDSDELSGGLHFKAAQVYEEQLQDFDKAIHHCKIVIDLDPTMVDAANMLERLYQVGENYTELAAIYLRKVEMIHDLYEQKDLLFKASQIYEEILENADTAIEVYRRILELDEDDLRAIEQLETLFLRMEKWEELQDIYSRKVDLVETAEEKKEILYVLGAVYENEVKDVEQAISTYQRIIEFDSEDFQAIQRLDMLYTEAEEWHDLLAILEREVELAADPDEVSAYKYRIAELFVRKLDDPQRAIDYLRDILTTTPEHQPSIALLEDLIRNDRETMLAAEVLEPIYQDYGKWRELIAVHEAKLKHIDDPWQKVDLLHQMAGILESDLHLDAPSEAFDVYARAITFDRLNERTLEQLDVLSGVSGRHQDLANILDNELESAVDDDAVVSLALRAGVIYEEKLDSADKAIERYQKVLSVETENREAILRLDKLLQISERWSELAEVLRKETLIMEDPMEALDVQFRLGQLHQTELEDVQKAIEVYRDILASEPTHETSASALELLFAEGTHRNAIAEILEPLYRMHAEWGRLISLEEARLEDLADKEDRIALLHKIAETHEERMIDPVEAFKSYCRAFAEDAFEERSGEEVERLASSTDSWQELAEFYRSHFGAVEDVEVKKFVAKRMARICEEELSDLESAEQAYRACLDLGSDDMDVLTSLDRLYTHFENWPALIAILEKLADVEPDTDTQVSYIYRIGDTYQMKLGELEAARKSFHRVVDDIYPGHFESLERLELIYADLEKWSELYDIYNKMNDHTDSDSLRSENFSKMATIAAECLEDEDRAVELWNSVLEIRGEDATALDALADLYSRQENWSELVEVLERSVTVAEDDYERIKLYSQLGLVWGECLERDRNALENWENVLTIDPQNLDSLRAIIKIHEANKDWHSLIENIDRILEVGAPFFEMEELRDYYAKLGHIYSEHIEENFDSIEAWKKACDVDPSYLDAVLALEALYREQEMHEELAGTLGDKAELLTADEQIDAWLAQAVVYEDNLYETARAKEPYSQILSVAPLHDYAFEKIVGICTEQEEWRQLTEFYSNRLNYVVDQQARVKLLCEAAKIYEEKLEEVENAYLVMQQAFQEDYTNDDTADYLEKLASEAGKWNELLAACNQVLQDVEERDVQISLCLKIGKWYANELQHAEYAIAYYQRVLQLETDNVPALRLMGELYRRTSQWPELVEVLRRAVDSEEDDHVKKDIFVELGQIYEDYLEDTPAARKSYKQALEIDAGLEGATNALERLLAASDGWKDLIPILRKKIEAVEDTETIIGTTMRIGEIYEEQLDNSNAAIDEYRRVLEIDQSQMRALKGLERLYVKLEQWQDLLDVLEIQLEYATSERERITLLGRIGTMLEEEFLKPDQAAERFEQVLEIDPGQETTLQALERIYRQNARWQDLIQTLERHIDIAHEREQKIALYLDMGQVNSQQIKDNDLAQDAYRAILDLDSDHPTALDELAKLQTVAEDWSGAHDTLRHLAELLVEPEQKVDLYFRLGELNEEHLMDRGAAVEYLQSVLDVEPGHLKSLATLRKIYIDEGEWIKASRILEAEQEYTENPRHKSKLLFELGNLRKDKLQEPENAVAAFEAALGVDPDNEAAAEPLVDVYIEALRWTEAEQLLEMLLRLGDKRNPDDLLALQRKFGLVCSEVGKTEQARDAYQAAYDADTGHLETLLALANLQFQMAEWDKAFKLYQMVLVHHRDSQTSQKIVEIFYRLGQIKTEVKERRKALNMFDKALEVDAAHLPTLDAVIGLHEEQKNFEQVIHYKKQMMDAVDDDRKFDLLVDIADIWQGKLKNSQKAVASYEESLELKSDDRPVLHKLLPIYQATKQWQKVTEIISKVVALEEDEEKKAALLYAMGVICRDELKNGEEAVKAFNEALDSSTASLKAFEAIDKLLTQQKDWKSLERNYRKMLHRIAGKGNTDLEINLWHFLGEIYRSRMQNFEAAAESFKMAASLDPGNAMRHEILAELYTALPGRLDDAVQEHQYLIAQNPYRVDSYKALRKLYFDNKQYDKAWCLCATLAFLKKANPEEQQFFEQYRTKGMVRAQARLDNELWMKHLFHKDESIYIGKIFELVTRAVRSLKVQPIKAFGLNKKQKRPMNDTVTFSKTFFYAAQVMGLQVVPDLYIQEDKPGGLNYAVTDPTASASGAAMLTGYTPQDLLFVVTKHLTYYRPEHYLRWVLPTRSELKMLLLAALKIGAPEFPMPEGQADVLQQWIGVLQQNLTNVEIENLRKVVKRFIKDGSVIDLKQWIRTVDLTACRAGLLLANDLEVAARMVQNDPAAGVDELPPKEKIKELVLFSISEEYFKLRESLGIVIGQ